MNHGRLTGLTLVCRAAAPVVSALLAYGIAYAVEFENLPISLSRSRGCGWIVLALVFLMTIYRCRLRLVDIWFITGSTLLVFGLLVDQLPLLSTGKAQISLLLVGLSQWALLMPIRAPIRFYLQVALPFLGLLVETMYLYAALQHRNLAGVL
jgi:hypothetical protein